MLFRSKCSLPLRHSVTFLLVTFPVGFLTFNRAVICLTTTCATEHLAAFRHVIRLTAAWVAAPAQLLDGLDIFVFLIQTGTRNALPVVLNQCVVISFSVNQFHYL